MNAVYVRRALFVALLFLLFMPLAWAQSGNGSVEGIVTDASNAVVPGAAISARNVETDAKFTAQTNAEGLFRFAVVPVGRYEVRVEHDGFATRIWKDVQVTVGAKVNLPSPLKKGTKAEEVVVTSAPVVEPTRSDVSTALPPRLVREVPINGRNYLDEIPLTPAAQGAGGSYAGQHVMNSVLVDGADNNDSFNGLPVGRGGGNAPYQYSKDSIREVQVLSNAYPAEFGFAGGVANTVTRSGTNQFHGTAFEFYRDKSMNANNFINTLLGEPKSSPHINQFGGNVGGPILRGKLFFFFNYDGQRNNAANIPNLQNVPCGGSNQPACDGFQLVALSYLNARVSPYVRTLDQNVYFPRLDWQVNAANLLTGSWNRQRFNGLNQVGSGRQQALEHAGTAIADTDVLNVSLVSTLSPSTVSNARFAYLRSDDRTTANSSLPGATVMDSSQTVFVVGGSPGNPNDTLIDQLEFSETVSSLLGRHGLKAGMDLIFDRITSFSSAFIGSYQFNSVEDFGMNFCNTPPLPTQCPNAGNAPGNQDSFQQSFSNEGLSAATRRPDNLDLGAFVEDEWRVRRNLTFNLGLRYDIQVFARPPANGDPKLAGVGTGAFPIDKGDFGPRLGVAWAPFQNRLVFRAGYGIVYARTLGNVVGAAAAVNGFTVLPITIPSTVGTATCTLAPAGVGNTNPPCFPNYPATDCQMGAQLPCGPPSSKNLPKGVNINPGATVFSRDYRAPYLQQGHLGVEMGVTKDLALSVSYLVVKGTHLQRSRDVNLCTPNIPAPCTAPTTGKIPIACLPVPPAMTCTPTILTFETFAPNPAMNLTPSTPRPITTFNRIVLFESAANSVYHGLVFQIRKRFSRNFLFQGSYTFSKVIDDKPDNNDTGTGNNDGMTLQNPLNARADRGPGGNDQRHRFVLSGTWHLDYGKNLPKVARAILRVWDFSGIFTEQTGQPYSGVLNFDLNDDGNKATDRTPGEGRNTFYNPRTSVLDPKLVRDIRLKEGVRLQLGWEAFNVFNHPNVTGLHNVQYSVKKSSSGCGSVTPPCLVPQTVQFGHDPLTAFGAPQATSGPRIMQLSAKFIF